MRRQTAILLAVLLALVGLAGSPAGTQQGDLSPVTAIVSLTGSASATALRGVRVVSELPSFGMVVVTGTADALRSLRGRAGVRGVTPDYQLAPTAKDASPGSGSLFAGDHLNGLVATDGAGAGVTVAVVDTGISDTPALNRASGRLHDGINTSGIASFADGYGHGTFMANLVAGGRAPGSGSHTLGVAPAASVVNVKVAGSTGNTSLVQVLAAFSWIDYFADRIDIVEFAYSGARPGAAYGPDPLTDAIERMRASGILSVVSSGNVSGQLGDPGFDPYALTVGAADVRPGTGREVAGFSGYGNVYGVVKPDVVASGVGLLSLLPVDSLVAAQNPQSLQPNGLYRGSGTSHASAITAGLAATVLQRFPDATPGDVKATLRSTARNISGTGSGQGLVSVPEQLYRADGDQRRNAGTGEEDLDQAAWLANSWLDGAWLEDTAASWSAASWSAASWSAASWSAGSWSAASWSAASWSAASWSAASWSAASWSAASWSARSWS
ncbi:MAG: S8 family serine peptidase [Mycobacteriales bacterium]